MNECTARRIRYDSMQRSVVRLSIEFSGVADIFTA